MKLLPSLLALTLASISLAGAADKPLFNGKDLSNWEGNTDLWSVKDGAIVGMTTAEKPAKGNTFLIWKGGDVSDFELTFKYKTEATNDKGFANSGVQYRSKVVDPVNFVVAGYQADFEAGPKYSGILYEEKGRGILALRGEKNVIKESADPKKPTIEKAGKTSNPEEVQASIKAGDWNDYKVVAKGNHLQHFINGKLTIDVTDETAIGAKSGILALQLHAGPPMKVSFKDMTLKTE